MGVDGAGTLETPPVSRPRLAGWYRSGPSPGERGNAVLVGHVDTRKAGPAVFYQLGRLTSDDEIEIERADGSVAVFVVDAVRSFPKRTFPSALVYGPTDGVGLRLVTCGGGYDKKRRAYRDNVVVFATLAAWR
jgi:sortase (surface protein transpeptidase)